MTFNILGKRVKATFDQELAEAICQAWLPTMSLENAMKTIARQAHTAHGVEVRTDSTREFLFDLQLFNLLQPVEDPWLMFGLDGIKLKLFGPAAPSGWTHRFIWSSEQPQIASISDNYYQVVRPILLAELPETDYQYKWLQHHLADLSRRS